MGRGVSFGLRHFLTSLLVVLLSLIIPFMATWEGSTPDSRMSFGLGLLLGAFLCAILASRLHRSISETIRAAEDIGRGDYQRRLHFPPSQEFSALARAINKMARDIEAQITTITDQKSQLEAILDGMKEGVMVLDAEGRVRGVNRALRRIVGSLDGVAGRRPIEVVASPELQLACDKILAEPERPEQTVVSLEIEPEKDRVHEVSIVKLKDNPGQLGAVAVFHDLTEIKMLDRVRRDFAANVTHELRTPLTSIKGYAETLLLSEAELSPEKRRFLDIILKNANHMSKMVEDMLTLARMENAPAKAPSASASEAGAAAALALRECEVMARDKAVTVDARLPAEGLYVAADSGQLTQVFRNLVENAIRYSPSGGRVMLSHLRDHATVTFLVQDDGPGIPVEERQRVFERFYRVQKHRSKVAGSTGLGLAIAKHIVERHGGRIWADRSPDGMSGAALYFTLPEAVDPGAREAGNGARPERAPAEAPAERA